MPYLIIYNEIINKYKVTKRESCESYRYDYFNNK